MQYIPIALDRFALLEAGNKEVEITFKSLINFICASYLTQSWAPAEGVQQAHSPHEFENDTVIHRYETKHKKGRLRPQRCLHHCCCCGSLKFQMPLEIVYFLNRYSENISKE